MGLKEQSAEGVEQNLILKQAGAAGSKVFLGWVWQMNGNGESTLLLVVLLTFAFAWGFPRSFFLMCKGAVNTTGVWGVLDVSDSFAN